MNKNNDNIHSIYSYDLSNLKPSIKVRFVYVLKGRGKEKGIVKEKKGEFWLIAVLSCQ